jgi:hypothetical protein
MNASLPVRIIAVTFATVGAAALVQGCSGSASVESDVVVETFDYYEPCFVDEDCPFDAACYDIEVDYGDVIVIDAMCTYECAFDDECEYDGRCLDAAGPPLCYARCFDDLDCWEGFACVDLYDDFDPVCAPW